MKECLRSLRACFACLQHVHDHAVPYLLTPISRIIAYQVIITGPFRLVTDPQLSRIPATTCASVSIVGTGACKLLVSS